MAGRSVIVELRVKAQDEASKALDAVAKSLQDLGRAGSTLQGGTTGVNKYIEDLGKNVGGLESLFGKLEAEQEKAGSAATRYAATLAALNQKIDDRKRRIEELKVAEANYSAQLSKTFVGPRQEDVTRGALSKISRELRSQTTGLQGDTGRIDALIGKIADAREATRAIKGVQGEVASAIQATNAEYLKQIDVLNRVTAAETRAAEAAKQTAQQRSVGATINRVTGVSRAPVDNAGLRAAREADLSRTFAPVFAAEDAAKAREMAAALDATQKRAKEAATALGEVQRYARDVAEALDPAAKATRLLSEEQKRLNSAVSGGFLSQGQADTQLKRFKDNLDGSAEAASRADREFQSLSTYVQELRRDFDRAGYAERFLAQETAKLDAAVRKGILSQNEYGKALESVKRKAEQLGEKSNPQLLGLNPYQTQNLLFQFNDVATQLASGTSLTQTLAQQGGQILQLFPRVGNTVIGTMTAAGGSVAAFIGILGGVAVAISRAVDNAARLREFTAVLTANADGANYSAQQLLTVAKSLAEIGVSAEDAMKIVRVAIKSGFDQSAVADFALASKGLAVVLGVDVSSAAQTLADALTGGYDALVELDKQTNIFTDSELTSIRAMIENGDALGANAEAARILGERYGKIATDAEGPWSKAINGLTASWSRLLDTLANSSVIQGLVAGLTSVANTISDIVSGINQLSANPLGAYLFGVGFGINPGIAVSAAGALNTGSAAPTPAARPAQGSGPAQQELDRILSRAGNSIVRGPNGFTGSNATTSSFYAEEIARANELVAATAKQGATVRDIYRDTLERAKAEGKVTTEAEKQTRLAADLKRIRAQVNSELGAPRNPEEARVAENVVQERLTQQTTKYNDQLKQVANERKAAAAAAEREAKAQTTLQNTLQFQAAALLREREGFISKAKYDRNAFRVGFGSDTVTRSDGTVQPVTANTTTTRADAERDLARRIDEFANVVKQQIGASRFAQFSAPQQAALVSIAYNYGKLPERIIGAVKEGTTAQIVAAVKGLRNDNGGINAARRDREASILGTPNLAVEQGAQQVILDRDKVQKEFNADLEDEIAKRERAVEAQRELVGLEGEALLIAKREQAVQEAIAAARAKLRDSLNDPNATLTKGQETAIRKSVEGGFDLQRNNIVQSEMQTKVNELLGLRDAIQQQIRSELERGNAASAQALEGQLTTINGRLVEASQALLEYQIANAKELGLSAEAIDALKLKQDALNESTRQWVTILGVGGQQIANVFTGAAVNALDQFAQAIANGANVFKSLGQAFRQFAADFLLQIAKMIQQQIIFALVSKIFSAIGGAIGGGLSGVGTSANGIGAVGGVMAHGGGVIGMNGTYGAGTGFRSISPAMLATATRYHSGGIAGLKPGEVPAVLMRGEEVLTRDDPRHMMNGGGGRGDVKIVNTFDEADFFSKGANTRSGEKAILNLVRSNPRAFKAAMGGG